MKYLVVRDKLYADPSVEDCITIDNMMEILIGVKTTYSEIGSDL